MMNDEMTRPERTCEAGYTLVMFVFIIAVMSIAMGVAVQTAEFQMRREREAELIFRGQQFVEAIRLYKVKYGRYPMQLKEIYEAKPRVLRKRWKDPITDSENWGLIFLGQEGVRPGQQGRQLAGPGAPGAGLTDGARPIATQSPFGDPSEEGDGGDGKPGEQDEGGGGSVGADRKMGPIVGVHSTSCDEAVKIFEGHSTYCEWRFIYREQQQPGGRPGGPQPGQPPVGWHPGDQLERGADGKPVKVPAPGSEVPPGGEPPNPVPTVPSP
jgi:type II secretory pathway pseudopilin PulG